MKKLCLFIFTISTILPLAALRCGDRAAELPRLKYINGRPQSIAAEIPGNKLRVVTFILTRAGNSRTTAGMLSTLDRINRGRVEQTLITPDPESDAATLLPLLKNSSIAFAVDSSRRITMQYMAGTLLYPKSFVIDPKGRIIWAGESVDLPEMLQEFFDGTFDAGAAEKLAPMLEEMQALLRESNERKLKKLADDIFAISPAHPGALRMRLFSLENSGRISQAWQLLDDRLKAAPPKARLYFTVLDFISRYRHFTPQLSGVLNSFDANIKNEELRSAMAWELLNRFQFDITALKYADRLLGNKIPSKAEFRKMWYASRARIACLTGDIDGAIRFQKQCTVPGRPDPMLEYFEGAAQLRRKKR